MTAHKQTTEGGDPAGYTTGYTYNLSGALVEETCPSTRVVKNILDPDGNLSVVQSKKAAGQPYWNYAQNFAYSPSGAVASVQLGSGRWESTVFNSRLQPTRIALGTTVNETDLLKLDYEYGDWATGGTVDATKNSGNIAQQTITVPNSPGHSDAFTATQKYYYDPLNRIDDSAENINGSQTWRQDFSYDRYGNRSLVEASTTTIPRSCGAAPDLSVCSDDHKRLNPAANVSNNRLSSADGYQYDLAGNTTKDPQSRKFTYDAENKQTKVETLDANGDVAGTVGEYSYDGDGRRVKKYVPSTGETTVFVYDAGGKLVAEYSTIVAPQTEAKVSYLTSDHLGSPRVDTDQSGAVISRHDYHPFGEEIQTQQRLNHPEYAGDSVRKQFTGYERDKETELDFAQARYYAKELGRFTTVDPILMMKDRLLNPQSINLYSYSVNNPLALFDPSGEIVKPVNDESQKRYDDYKNWIEEQYKKNPKKFESLHLTLKTLEESGVTYNLSVTTSSKLGDNVEGSVDISSKGDSIDVNVVLAGGSQQEFSQNSIFAHELEHARQFNDGEWGFELLPDKNGGVTVDGKTYRAGKIGYDIGDETKAFKAMLAAANGFDMSVKFPHNSGGLPFLQGLDGTKDKDADNIIARLNNDYNDMKKVSKGGFYDGTAIPKGTAIRPTSGAGRDGRRVFGCVGGGCKW